MKEWKILRDNSILIQGLLFEDKEVVYTNIHYGANVKYTNICSKSNGKVIMWVETKLEKMKGRWLLVVITKHGCLKLFKDNLIMGTSNTDLNSELSSGIIILCICNLSIKSHTCRLWGRVAYEVIRRCKENKRLRRRLICQSIL